MATITVNGIKDVYVVDSECGQRPCFRLMEDKGSFTPGVGYTRYYEKSRWCCGTNHEHGCPHVGGHVKCHGIGGAYCRHVFGEFIGTDYPELTDEPCPLCGCTEKYLLSDMLPEPVKP